MIAFRSARRGKKGKRVKKARKETSRKGKKKAHWIKEILRSNGKKKEGKICLGPRSAQEKSKGRVTPLPTKRLVLPPLTKKKEQWRRERGIIVEKWFRKKKREENVLEQYFPLANR